MATEVFTNTCEDNDVVCLTYGALIEIINGMNHLQEEICESKCKQKILASDVAKLLKLNCDKK